VSSTVFLVGEPLEQSRAERICSRGRLDGERWEQSGSRGSIPLRSGLAPSLKIRGTERLRSTFSSLFASRLPPFCPSPLSIHEGGGGARARACDYEGWRWRWTSRQAASRARPGGARGPRTGGARTRGRRSSRPAVGRSTWQA
jgi:hypothetical protein